MDPPPMPPLPGTAAAAATAIVAAANASSTPAIPGDAAAAAAAIVAAAPLTGAPGAETPNVSFANLPPGPLGITQPHTAPQGAGQAASTGLNSAAGSGSGAPIFTQAQLAALIQQQNAARHRQILYTTPTSTDPPPAQTPRPAEDTGFDNLPQDRKLALLSFCNATTASRLSTPLLDLLACSKRDRSRHFNAGIMETLRQRDAVAFSGFH